MKKILLSVTLAAATNINAQLVVDSLGRVGIGTESPICLLSVGSSGANDATFYFNASNKTGLYSNCYYSSSSKTEGIYSKTRNYSGNCLGVSSYALGGSDSSLSQSAIGVGGYAGYSSTGVGVYGGRIYSTFSPTNFAGIYGSETWIGPSFSYYSDTYAGFFNGKVRVTNGIYATVLSPSASPSQSGQNGTTTLSDIKESVTDKLSQVQAVQFLRYDPTKETNTAKGTLRDLDIDNLSSEELDSLSEAMGEVEPEPYLSPIQYGLDAEQLKAVYPELVYEDANGNVSINYVEMVPLLVQSINELSKKVAELEGTSSKKSRAKTRTSGIEDNFSNIDIVRMDQNKPNPFSESTVISLIIPGKTQKASIFIYDMSGKQVQSIAVAERGETDITVYARDLTTGMYIYTLVVDSKVKVTRRMIVTN